MILMKSLKYIALFGNLIFILWILYNGIDDGFRQIGNIQGIVPLGLAILLALNCALLWKRK